MLHTCSSSAKLQMTGCGWSSSGYLGRLWGLVSILDCVTSHCVAVAVQDIKLQLPCDSCPRAWEVHTFLLDETSVVVVIFTASAI